METITVNVTEEQIRNGVEKCVTEALKSSYSNPINDAVQKSLKAQEGTITILVNELIQNAVSNPEFKSKLADIVIAKMIELALNKR